MSIVLSAADEERARAIHDRTTIFVCHDHTLFPEDQERMRAGGVTAKQVHLATDGQVWAPRDTLWSSASSRTELLGELARIGVDDASTRTAEAAPSVATSPRDGFLRRALIAMDYLHWQVERSGGAVRIALEPEDVIRAKKDGAVALVLGSEGARLIEARLEILRILVRLGLRHIGLTWSWRGAVGAPQSDRSGAGLTEFGRSLVAEANDEGVILDCAHLAGAAVAEVIDTSRVPVLMSHSGALALNPTQPIGVLLPDEHLRALAARGGVIAVHFMSQVVKPGRDKARLEHLLDQFAYLTELMGEDHIACGPDYATLDPRMWENWFIPPFTYADGVEDVSRFRNVTRGLVSHGFSDEAIAKILGGNLLRLWSDVRGARRAARLAADPRGATHALGELTEGVTPL
jgi:microsomal dipeptidase-like Zn-dependent dipeptidase